MTTIDHTLLATEDMETHRTERAHFIGDQPGLLQAAIEGMAADLDAQRRAGRTLYYCGTGGDDAGKLFMHTPEGRRFEYRIVPDGSREIVREPLP
jgi:hypothetical protein